MQEGHYNAKEKDASGKPTSKGMGRDAERKKESKGIGWEKQHGRCEGSINMHGERGRQPARETDEEKGTTHMKRSGREEQ